ncbi:MAG: FtsX-like permease family protein [Tepidiformaceae bacterium]
MNELFGLSMTYIAAGCVAVTLLIFLIVGFLAWRNPIMFKNGLRNIPRRKSQTVLIIVGLMLSTVIITAAFGTGDTMTHSVTNEVYGILGPVDEIIEWDTAAHPAAPDQQVIPMAKVREIEQQFANDPSIKGFVPYIREVVPTVDTRTRLNHAFSRLVATVPGSLDKFGGLKDVDGKQVNLAPNEIALNKALADKVNGKIGDTIQIFYKNQPTDLKVVAIVPNTNFGGTSDPSAKEGAAVNYQFLSTLTSKTDVVDFIAVSNNGSTRGGLSASGAVTAQIKPALAGTPFKVNEIKKDLVKFSELIGNIFTSLFLVIGLFSIAAGVLLIFLIFVMLAAERKPEMGMARAVGAKRRQIVESFLAEGMGYDLGAALIGLVVGVGVAAIMINFVSYVAGDQLGLNLSFSVSVRSLIVAFCLGVITTFIVVFLASYRASRINIVAAIRDLPESHLPNPEQATWRGFLRATLNGFAAFGITLVSVLLAIHFSSSALLPLFLLAAVSGIAGPWLGMLRGHNFGASKAERKTGERIPVWPFILGAVLLIAGIGIVILAGYALALLIVRLTRDRKPSSIPAWLMLAGIVVAPLGVVLAALQDRDRQVAWSVGVGMVGLATGILLIQWGIDAEQMFLFGLGASLIALWAAVSLRYFRVHERLSFTLISAALLALWYLLPGGRLSWLVGNLNAGTEMFFLSGATMVTAGTFIVVYNADVILPFIAVLGSRFGKITPAVKTAVAYPLTSRFRTGLTIAMIGLIMFVLSMQAALNTNFAKAFSGADAKGGYDVDVSFNGNNLSPNLVDDIQTPNKTTPADLQTDTSKIGAVGEIRFASPAEVDIKDPTKSVPADPTKEYSHYALLGAADDFIDSNKLPLQFRAQGYADDQAVWQALKTTPNLAIIPAALTAGDQGFGGPGIDNPLTLASSYTKDSFTPFKLTLREPGTNTTTDITVIGQMKDSAATFWPGIMISKASLLNAYPDSKGQTFFLALQSGTDAKVYANHVEATLIRASSDSLGKVIDDNEAINRGFLDMFQGFLALGLLVGIAALGVISFRAVVERRQQIGMLRAIGYQRSMVQLSFLLESGFIALSGIVLGIGLGLTFAWSLFTSGQFGETSSGVSFTVPWMQVVAVVLFAFVASLLMTYLPARSASKVAIAEALRYE